VQPPADAALVGQANRTLASRGVPWHWGQPGTPGSITAPQVPVLQAAPVSRRYRLEGGGRGRGGGASDEVLATVNGEPWLVRFRNVVLLGSRLDTAWTTLPTTPGFVPFIDALVNRIAIGQADVSSAEGAPHVEFRTRGADTVGATVFGPDPRESDLTPATPALATAAFGGRDRAEVLSASDFAIERFSGTRRADASVLLLIVALVLAATELVVATRTR